MENNKLIIQSANSSSQNNPSQEQQNFLVFNSQLHSGYLQNFYSTESERENDFFDNTEIKERDENECYNENDEKKPAVNTGISNQDTDEFTKSFKDEQDKNILKEKNVNENKPTFNSDNIKNKEENKEKNKEENDDDSIKS